MARILEFKPKPAAEPELPAAYEFRCDCGCTSFQVCYEAGNRTTYAVCTSCSVWHFNLFEDLPE